MAVIITKADGNLSTASNFYRVEAHNLNGIHTAQNTTALTTAQYIPLTFANAGNFTGVVLSLWNGSSTQANPLCDRSIDVALQQIHTVNPTMAVASPGVVTMAAHGFSGGEIISFTTTGTLLTGIVAGTPYYVRYINANTFNISATPAGALINFSGSQSGTHTLWADKAIKTLSWSQIKGGTTSIAFGVDAGGYTINFTGFSASIAVDTTASKWRIRAFQNTVSAPGTVGTINICWGQVATNIQYAAYCDTAVSFANGDTPIFAHYCTIDQSFNFNSVLGTGGDVVNNYCGVVCTNMAAVNVNDVCFFRCLAPAAPYTFTFNGMFLIPGHGGIRFGTSALPIPISNKITCVFGTPTVGTTKGGIYGVNSLSQRSSVFMYGEYPTQIKTKLSADSMIVGTCTISNGSPAIVTRAGHGLIDQQRIAFTTTGALPTGLSINTDYYVKYINTSTFNVSATPGGANINTSSAGSGTHSVSQMFIVTTDDMSAKWNNGDIIGIGKQAILGAGNASVYTIGSISGTTITLTTPLLANQRLTGGAVINITESKYGISLRSSDPATTVNLWDIRNGQNFNLEGIYNGGVQIGGAGSSFAGSYTSAYDDDSTSIQETVKNSVCYSNLIGGSGSLLYGTSPSVGIKIGYKGMSIDNVWGVNNCPVITWAWAKLYRWTGGIVNITNSGCISSFGQNSPFGIAVYNINGWTSQNGTNGIYFTPYYGSNIQNCESYGCTTGLSVLNGTSAFGCKYKNLTIDRSTIGISIGNAQSLLDMVYENVNMGSQFANTTNLSLDTAVFFQALFKNTIGIESLPNTLTLNNSQGISYIKTTNGDGITNNDFVYLPSGNFRRTGTGLTDTTVRTAGTNKYSIRLNSLLGTEELAWKFNVPNGNIQNKTMTIGIWCNIASSKYWTGGTNYQMPRLTLEYDDGASTAYAEAAQILGWQYLFVPVTPLTTFGEVKCKLTTINDTGQRGTVSITNANPGIVTLNNHGFSGNEPVIIDSTGSITGLVLRTRTYYVKYIDANTFYLSATPGGANIDTSGSQSGIHTLFTPIDAYVYFDDASVFYPPGTSLDLGGLDVWSDGLPIIPPIATNINASDVWNVAVASASNPGSVGEMLKSNSVKIGNVVSATANSIVIDSGASTIDNYYNENYILILAGTGTGQTRRIVSYNGTTKSISINRNWSTTPDATSRYNIVPFFSIENAVWDATTSSHTLTGTIGKTVVDTKSDIGDTQALIFSR